MITAHSRDNINSTMLTGAKILGPVGGILTSIGLSAIFIPTVASAIGFAAVPLTIAGGAMLIATICMLAPRYICPKSAASETVIQASNNSINWDQIIVHNERLGAYIDIVKNIFKKSKVASCPYKEIYILPLITSRPNIAFDDDAPYANAKPLSPPDKALLIQLPLDEEKSNQIKKLNHNFAEPHRIPVDEKMITFKEFQDSQKRVFFSEDIVKRLFTA